MNYFSIDYIFLFCIITIQAILIGLLLQKRKKSNSPKISPATPDKKYRDLFENANDAIFILDKDQNFVDINQKATELFGYSRDEYLTLGVKDLIPPTQQSISDEEFERLREQGKYEKFIGQMKSKDGRWLDIEVNSSSIIDKGKVIGSRDIVRDITDRKRIEAERESMINDLQNALEEIKSLKGILPICSFCKKIRDDTGYWNQVEDYIGKHSKADFSHSLCPECAQKNYPELFETDKDQTTE
jgi:PAS domain S-box-containing protein